jgi:hypothetical protein
MKKLLLIGLAVPAVVALMFAATFAGFALSDRYYWWAQPELAKAFRASTSPDVRAAPIERLEGLSIAEAQAHAEDAEFDCLPLSDVVHCVRFVPEMNCGEDWVLSLRTAEGVVSATEAVKHDTCAEMKEAEENVAH